MPRKCFSTFLINKKTESSEFENVECRVSIEFEVRVENFLFLSPSIHIPFSWELLQTGEEKIGANEETARKVNIFAHITMVVWKSVV